MARTSFAGPVYSEGRPVVTQDLTTGELVGQIPIVYPALEMSLPVEGEFRDNAIQLGGPAVETPRNVLFGPGGLTMTGIASVDANGVVTILKDAALVFVVRLRAQRSGAAGVAVLVIWGEKSVDGGASWSQLANVGTVSLNAAADIAAFYDVAPVRVSIGEQYRVRFARSGSGTNAGDLGPQPLGGGLSFLNPVPAAYLSIYRFA